MKKETFACLLLAGAALPAVAHHSFSMFDEKKEVVLKGAVKEFQWGNPHTWIQLNVTDASGKVVAALGISGPLERLSREQLEKSGERLIEVTEMVSRRLGYSRRD